MPNIKSAVKRTKVIFTKTMQNKKNMSLLRTKVKYCLKSIKENSTSANELYKDAVKFIDKMASRGLIHKNNAARRKSRLSAALNTLNKKA